MSRSVKPKGTIELSFALSVPPTEYSLEFIQGMLDRMAMSYFKYGSVLDADTKRVDPIKNLKLRLEKYEETGNLEWLMDAANFAMIEFMKPSRDGAFFKATTSAESPGRVWTGEVDRSQRGNTEF